MASSADVSASALGERFPKLVRVRRSVDYRRIQGRGTKIRTRHLLVLYLQGRGSESRFGLTVSRKVGNAVARNRVKRWLRESIRHRRCDLDGCWDVVFIASPRAAGASFKAVDCDVAEVLQRIGARRRR